MNLIHRHLGLYNILILKSYVKGYHYIFQHHMQQTRVVTTTTPPSLFRKSILRVRKLATYHRLTLDA